MGSDNSRVPRDREVPQGQGEPPLEYRAAPQRGMRASEPVAVALRDAAVDDPRFPELVQRSLVSFANVLRNLDREQQEIARVRERTREVLARIKAA